MPQDSDNLQAVQTTQLYATPNSSSHEGNMPLSLSQSQVWMDQQLFPDSAHLNVGGMAFIDGLLDLDVFEAMLYYLSQQFEALRLLPQPNGEQIIVDKWDGAMLHYQDLGDEPDVESAVHQCWESTFRTKFLLDGKQRPWLFQLLRVSDVRYGSMICCHHLVMDGYGVTKTLHHMCTIYNELKTAKEASLKEPYHYSQYIAESIKYVDSKAYQQDKDYWAKTIPEFPQHLLDAKYPKKTQNGLTLANYYSYFIDKSYYAELQDFAKSYKLTTYHLFLAALVIYFCRILDKEDIIIGIPVLNRSGKKYKESLGMFVVVVPLKVHVKQTDTLEDIFSTIVLALRGAYRHARYPLSQLAKERKMLQQGHDRMFDVLLSYELHDFTLDFNGALMRHPHQLFSNVARYPLSITVGEFHEEEPVEVILESSQQYFNQNETLQLADRLQYLFRQMTANPQCTFTEFFITTPAESKALVHDYHKNIVHCEQPLPYVRAFEQCVKANPNGCALKWLEGQVSYQQLNDYANFLATLLIQKGVKKGDCVAVIMPRLPETMAVIVGIAKAGGVYVPIDPCAPSERMTTLVKLSESKLVITTPDFSGIECNFAGTELIDFERLAISLDLLQHNACTAADSTDFPEVTAHDLAYLLFTSGSTGEPKGVLVEHGALSRRLNWLQRTFDYTERDVSMQSIALQFDPSLIEICLPLSVGAIIALPPAGPVAPLDLLSLCQQLQVSSIIFVPSVLRVFNQSLTPDTKLNLRVAISGGEVLHPSQAKQFILATGAQLYNLYGPTEATIFATAHCVNPDEDSELISIGKPVDDTRIYILDSKARLLPQGSVGEICIGGQGLARRYLQFAQHPSFIDDPFVSDIPESYIHESESNAEKPRLYRTGDAGFINGEGNVYFVGRLDQQIKLRGQRIEPSEIELALGELECVKVAAVKLVEQELHAWVELINEQAEFEPERLKQALAKKLPKYMIPQAFHHVHSMPFQSTGKIDYKALKVSENQEQRAMLLPKSDLERLLVQLWCEALEVEQISVDADFFHYGGDSIAALNLLSRIQKELGQKIPLSMLLEHSTVRSLASNIVQSHHPLVVELSREPAPKILYLAASGHGDAKRFARLAEALAGKFTVKMLQPPVADGQRNYSNIDELAEMYASLIELEASEFPIVLAGFSIGGVTMFETARRLLTRDITIEDLVLIDTAYPIWIMRGGFLWKILAKLVSMLRLKGVILNGRTLGSLFIDTGLNEQINALKSYKPATLSMPATLIISTGTLPWYRLLFKPWEKLMGKNLTQKTIEGFHGSIFEREQIAALAKLIGEEASEG